MTANNRFFYREAAAFRALSDVMIPALMRSRANERHIRIWCAGASTGQEPYSIAMSITDIAEVLAGWQVEIIATDPDAKALLRAGEGIYSQFEVQRGLPIRSLVKHFERQEEAWRISPHIRAMVQFREFNLLDHLAALGRFDIAFCRGVLACFDAPTRTGILARIARALSPDGYLVLGAGENIAASPAFRSVIDHAGIYAPVMRVSHFTLDAPDSRSQPQFALIAGGRR